MLKEKATLVFPLANLALSSFVLLMTTNIIANVSVVEANVLADSTVAVKRYTNMHAWMHPGIFAELWDMGQISYGSEAVVKAIHQIRPDFKALLYRNIRAIYRHREDEWQMALNNDWILKDENGQLVYSTVYRTNYLVDIGNSEYQKWVANWIKEKIDGLDGVFADESVSVVASEHFWRTSAPPINPRTGDFWKNHEIGQALVAIHNEIKKAISPKLLVCNGIFQGCRFWRMQNRYNEFVANSPLDGIMSEGLWYQYEEVWMSEEQWLKCLEFLIFVQDNFLMGTNRVFEIVCAVEKATGEDEQLPPGCTKEQMVEYAFASTLLGIKTNQNYLGLAVNPSFMKDVVQPLHDIDLGPPLGDYYKIKGTHVYARDFTNIKVLVNPTEDTFEVDLGMRVINVQPHTGVGVDQETGEILFGMRAQMCFGGGACANFVLCCF